MMHSVSQEPPRVVIVDDDPLVAESISEICGSHGWAVQTFLTAESLLQSNVLQQPTCVVLDLFLPDIPGLDLQVQLQAAGCLAAVILMSGQANVESAVRGMRNGAVTLLQKPVDEAALIAAVREAFEVLQRRSTALALKARYAELVASLTPSELETAELIANGKSNKQVAAIQGLSLRGVEDRRSRLMKHFGTRSLAEFVSAVKSALTIS